MLEAALGAVRPAVDPLKVKPIDDVVAQAEEASWNVLVYLGMHHLDYSEDFRLHLLTGLAGSTATNALAELVRKIGKERATPAVCGQQLKILGLLDHPELSEAEALIVETFINIVAGIDAYDKAAAERRAAADRQPEERKPIPIEDTTMETVDDAMATWGGRG